LWGPAPAITPTINKSTHNNPSNNIIGGDGDSSGSLKTGKKKRKGKRIDNSLLGFTVQADPDRVNVGEIEPLDK